MYICKECCEDRETGLSEKFHGLCIGLCEVCSRTKACLDVPPQCIPPAKSMAKKLIDRIDKLLSGEEVECFTCQQPMSKCMCDDERFLAAMFVAEHRGRSAERQGLERLISACRAWRKRTDSATLSLELAQAIDAYERSQGNERNSV